MDATRHLDVTPSVLDLLTSSLIAWTSFIRQLEHMPPVARRIRHRARQCSGGATGIEKWKNRRSANSLELRKMVILTRSAL